MMPRTILALLMTASVYTSVVDRCVGSEPWTGWLGPARDGWVGDVELPATWPASLTRVWEVEVGQGYGSPLVTDQRVYQHARQGDDEVALCLDLKSGDVIWQQRYRVPFKIGGGGDKHGKGPKSSPVLSDGRLFTMSITGDLIAWNAETGDRLWKSDYGSRFKINQPYWGVSTSPIVDGDRLIAHFGNDDEGVLVALDVKTGREVWSQGSDGTSYSSPLVVELEGVRQVVEWNHRAVVGVDADSGGLLWEYPFPHVGTNQNMPTPAVYKGRVLVGGENRGVYSIRPKRQGSVWTVEENWHQDKVALDMSTAVINGDRLFGFSHYSSGRLFCLDPTSGDLLWEGPPRTGENVTFLSLPDHVMALINNGEVRIIEARGDQYKVAASYRVSQRETWAPPVLIDGGLLTKDVDNLTRWSFEP